MTNHEDIKVECPNCKGTIFDKTDSMVLRSVQSKGADNGLIYRDPLIKCTSCDRYLCIIRDVPNFLKAC